MANSNCLENVKCPQCGQEHAFEIVVSVLVRVTDDGTEDIGGDYGWNRDSFCRCVGCGRTGALGEFYTGRGA
jgi:hypothetical protein